MRQSEGTSSEGRPAACELEPAILRAVEYVSQYMGSHDDWVDVKIEIMNSLRPELRRRFSRRDQVTREQVLNDFDRAVIAEYRRVSGVDLVVRTLAQRKSMRTGVEDSNS